MMVNSMLLGRSDLTFDEGEIAQATLRGGFRSVHSRVAEGPQPYGPAMIDVARKSPRLSYSSELGRVLSTV